MIKSKRRASTKTSIKMDRHRNNVQDSKTSLDSWTFDSRKSKLENNPRLLLRRVEDLNFSLRCNYVEKNLALLPHAEYFFLLKTMYYHNQVQNITLHNNKDIFVGERPFLLGNGTMMKLRNQTTSVRIVKLWPWAWKCSPRPTASSTEHYLGHSFSLYGPPSGQITYMPFSSSS